tara:strand:+ start:4961 stop:6205 length:1245 start_codon:yes stop_codon:yes gene_type:complete
MAVLKTKKSIFVTLLGTAIEHYDAMLITLSTVYFLPNFYGETSLNNTKIINLLFFSIALLGKPIGGIIFGLWGDKEGRKLPLSYSIIIMSLCSFLFSLTPTYNQIGIWSLLILVICRLLQGFSIGAETSGAITYIYEGLDSKNRYFTSSFIGFFSYLGGVAAMLVMILAYKNISEVYFWRIAFMFGGIVALFGFYMRFSLKESPLFIKKNNYPIKNIFNNKIKIITGALIVGCARVPFYIMTVYMNNIYKIDFKLPTMKLMQINIFIMLSWSFLFLIFGKICDKINPQKIFTTSLIFIAIFSYPFIYYINKKVEFFNLITVNFLFSIPCVGFCVPSIILLNRLFYTSCRYTSIALSYGIGSSLIGGLFPLISGILVQKTSIKEIPSFLIVFLFLSLLFVFKVRSGPGLVDQKAA